VTPDVYQRAEFDSFGTDLPGVCWRCRITETRDPLTTCRECRDELGGDE